MPHSFKKVTQNERYETPVRSTMLATYQQRLLSRMCRVEVWLFQPIYCVCMEEQYDSLIYEICVICSGSKTKRV